MPITTSASESERCVGPPLDPGKLLPIIIEGKIHPSEKGVPRPGPLMQHFMGSLDKGFQLFQFAIPDKGARLGIVKGENVFHVFLPMLVDDIDHPLYQKRAKIEANKSIPRKWFIFTPRE